MTDHVEPNVESVEDGSSDDTQFATDPAPTGEWESEPVTVESLEQELALARSDAALNQDRYLRMLAEMENFKKRIERTYSDRARSSHKDLLGKLLGVKDNLERALHYGGSSESGEGIMEGVRLTQYQLDQLLSQEGVREMDSEGQPFDPRREEAIQSIDNPELPDQTVTQVVRKGYTLGDEVLRPAQVIVNVHKSAEG